MNAKRIACHKCKTVWTFEPPLGRRDECPQCRADARCCLNCRFYDPGAHHECRVEQAEWVKEKAAGNFCSYFTATDVQSGRGSDADKARAKIDQLFGGKDQRNGEKAAAAVGGKIDQHKSIPVPFTRNYPKANRILCG